MIIDRRPYYWAGLAIGLLVAAFFFFGPKRTPEQLVSEEIALLAVEPWNPVYVQRLEFIGPQQSPTDVFVYGNRPDGTPVVVQFVSDNPYTAPTAIRRLQQDPPENRQAEILMVPRSLVQRRFAKRFDARATHVGVALFAGVPPQAEHTDATESDMGTEEMPSSHDG